MPPLYLALVFPDLALDAARNAYGDAGQPLALVRGVAGREIVIGMCLQAADAGVHIGQRRAAAEIVCPGLVVHAYQAEQEQATIAELAQWAYGYSSQIATPWPQCLVLEVGRSLSLHGGLAALRRRLRRDLDQSGYRHQLAIAPTMRAAHVLALVGDGTEVLQGGALAGALSQVSVVDARLPGNAGSELAAMGIERIGQLQRMEASALTRRFGKELAEDLARMHGQSPELANQFTPPPGFEQSIELGYDVDQIEPLLFALRRLTQSLSLFLSSRDAATTDITLHLDHGNGTQTPVLVRLLSPEHQASALFDSARGYLERAALPGATCGMRLTCDVLVSHRPQARDLFDTRPASATPWKQLRDRLAMRLGADAVYQIEPATDRRPEASWRPRRDDGACERQAGGAGRPMWLLTIPQALPTPPRAILSGPERIESGWWDGQVVRRDYYVVQTTDGRTGWAFTEVGDPRGWQLHGWF